MRTRGSLMFGATILVFCLGAPPARADALIDFGTGSAGKGGTISYAGGTSALVGSGIRIGVVTGVDTPLNADAHSVIGNLVQYGVVNFTTGAFEGYSGSTYTFGPGGSFQLYGNVPDAGVYGPGAGALLFSGVFNSATIGRVGSLNMFSASGIDTQQDPLLLDYFGLPPTTLFDFSSYVMAIGSIGSGDAFSVTAFSTDWANPDPPVQAEAVTPEPTSLLLLGSGLTMLGTAIRRRTRERRASRSGAPTRADR